MEGLNIKYHVVDANGHVVYNNEDIQCPHWMPPNMQGGKVQTEEQTGSLLPPPWLLSLGQPPLPNHPHLFLLPL